MIHYGSKYLIKLYFTERFLGCLRTSFIDLLSHIVYCKWGMRIDWVMVGRSFTCLWKLRGSFVHRPIPIAKIFFCWNRIPTRIGWWRNNDAELKELAYSYQSKCEYTKIAEFWPTSNEIEAVVIWIEFLYYFPMRVPNHKLNIIQWHTISLFQTIANISITSWVYSHPTPTLSRCSNGMPQNFPFSPCLMSRYIRPWCK